MNPISLIFLMHAVHGLRLPVPAEVTDPADSAKPLLELTDFPADSAEPMLELLSGVCKQKRAPACVGKWKDACYSPDSIEHCTESVPACKDNIPLVGDGETKLALLTENTHYRLGDLFYHAGSNWRASLLVVLSSPVFRDTMMRFVAKCSLTLNGKRLCDDEQNDADFEQKVRSASEGGGGYFCSVDSMKYPLQVTTSANKHDLAVEWLRNRHLTHGCGQTNDDEMVVQIRMGDVIPSVQEIDGVLSVALNHPSRKHIKTITLAGVLHFSGFGGQVNGHVYKHDSRLEKNIKVIDQLRQIFQGKGFRVQVRSEPVSDDDLCYASHVPHLLQNCQGTKSGEAKGGRFGGQWCRVVKTMRTRIHGKTNFFGEPDHERPKDEPAWMLFSGDKVNHLSFTRDSGEVVLEERT